MIVAGIDIGSKNYAVTVVEIFMGEPTDIVFSNTYSITSSKSPSLVKSQRVIKRILGDILTKYNVSYIAIEQQPWTFKFKHGTGHITALNIAIEAITITLAVQVFHTPIVLVQPKEWRKIAGLSPNTSKSLANYKKRYEQWKFKGLYVDFDLLVDVHQHDALFIAVAATLA